jgi:hypothetical protein
MVGADGEDGIRMTGVGDRDTSGEASIDKSDIASGTICDCSYIVTTCDISSVCLKGHTLETFV